jgi:hypothetical protein
MQPLVRRNSCGCNFRSDAEHQQDRHRSDQTRKGSVPPSVYAFGVSLPAPARGLYSLLEYRFRDHELSRGEVKPFSLQHTSMIVVGHSRQVSAEMVDSDLDPSNFTGSPSGTPAEFTFFLTLSGDHLLLSRR